MIDKVECLTPFQALLGEWQATWDLFTAWSRSILMSSFSWISFSREDFVSSAIVRASEYLRIHSFSLSTARSRSVSASTRSWTAFCSRSIAFWRSSKACLRIASKLRRSSSNLLSCSSSCFIDLERRETSFSASSRSSLFTVKSPWSFVLSSESLEHRATISWYWDSILSLSFFQNKEMPRHQFSQ